MSTRINWTNPNASFTEIRIYRTPVPFNEDNIPEAPIAVLTEGTSWLDTTTLQNVYYYYTIGVVVDGELILSPAKRTIHMPYTGPGPQELKSGDWSRGYFGVVSSAELFTPAELCTLCSLPSPRSGSSTLAKFVRNGKILFIPLETTNSAAGISWNLLYSKGLVYGTDDFGPPTGHGNAPVNQRKVITKGEHSFIVRALRGNDDPGFVGATPDNTKGEAMQLLTAIMNTQNFGADALDGLNIVDYLISGLTPLAEILNSNCMHYNTTVLNEPNTNCRQTTLGFWRPVLELIL